MRTSLILIGGGGHCKSVIDIIETNDSYDIAGIIEKDISEVGKAISGHEIIGVDNDLELIFHKNKHFIVTIGQIKNSSLRVKVYKKAIDLGGVPTSVFSINALISKHSEIGFGVSVGHFSTLNAGSFIGDNTIINNHVLIEHDTQIGNHCHISTSAVLNGDVLIGDSVFIGSNSTIVQGVSICSGCVIGAGTLVVRSIAESGTYIGVPAKRIK